MKRRMAVLFDMDGVLVPTEALRAKAHEATVHKFGGKVPIPFYIQIGGAGKSHEEVRSAFLDQSGICVSAEKYTGIFRSILKNLLQDIAPTPGIDDLLKLLRRNGCLLGVVSSSESVEVEDILQRTSLGRLFDVVVCGDQAAHKKPAPDLYLLALARLRLEPDYAVAVEDSDSGVKAALEAGLKVLAFRHRYNQDHAFAGAAGIFRSFRDAEKLAHLILASRR